MSRWKKTGIDGGAVWLLVVDYSIPHKIQQKTWQQNETVRCILN